MKEKDKDFFLCVGITARHRGILGLRASAIFEVRYGHVYRPSVFNFIC
jgi:hypothetical protein